MTYQGSQSSVGWGFETGGRQQKAGTLYGLRYGSLSFNPDVKFDRTRNMQSRPMALKARASEVSLPFKVDFDPDVNAIARLRTHHNGFAAITNPAGTTYDWTIRDLLSTDSPTAEVGTISIDASRDDNFNTLVLGGRIREMDLKVAHGKIAQCSLSGMASHYTHMKDSTMTTTGGTYTGNLRIRGNRLDSDAEDTTNHLKVKCTTAGALNGTALVKCTKGATAYGSTTIAVTAGVWYPFTLADGSNASGDPYNPVEFMLTTGGTLSLNDEFEVQAKRPAPSLSYSARQPLHANGLQVTIAGTSKIIDTFDLKFTRPIKEKRGCGSAYPYDILDDGLRSVVFTLSRDYVDRDLYLKMQSGTAVAVVATFNGDFIETNAGTNYYEKWTLTAANAQVLKAGADPTSDKQLQEGGIQIVSYYDGSSPDLTEVIRCTLATLT